jgi:hypothetical protein
MTEVRKAGQASFRTAPINPKGPYGAFATGVVGETRVRNTQLVAIEHLYNTSPSLQAARAILVGQLLSSGLSLTRNGEAVKLRPAFARHLEQHWMPFARRVVDSILKWGLVVVAVEDAPPAPFANLGKAKKTSGTPPQTDGRSDRLEAGARKRPRADGPAMQRVPIVPELLTYEVALTPVGRLGYSRTARVFSMAPANAYELEPEPFHFPYDSTCVPIHCCPRRPNIHTYIHMHACTLAFPRRLCVRTSERTWNP